MYIDKSQTQNPKIKLVNLSDSSYIPKARYNVSVCALKKDRKVCLYVFGGQVSE